MNDNEREAINHLTALQGEVPHRIGDHHMRRITPESLGILQMVGSPFAVFFSAALNGEKVTNAPAIQPLDINVFAWAHCAPEDEVLAVALECAPGFAAPAHRAALRFIRDWSMDDIARVVEFALSDAAATRAAHFNAAAPSIGDSPAKKNG